MRTQHAGAGGSGKFKLEELVPSKASRESAFVCQLLRILENLIRISSPGWVKSVQSIYIASEQATPPSLTDSRRRRLSLGLG
jgi:hypothetical protein